MKIFFGGSAAFTVATLLAASVLFYAKPLFAEVTTTTSQNPTSIQQQKEEQAIELAPAQTEKGEEASRASESAASTTPAIAALAKMSSASEEPSANVSLTKINDAPAVAATAITEPQAYVATAYNLPGRTASGLRVAKGIIAADPRVLPLGTRVRLEAGPYSGEYIVADTGSAVRGRKIDVWVPTYREACRFGRRQIKLSVLSYGGKRRTPRAARRSR
jgi:3D (Asp-Asp-Asp) domain-containing protein